MAEPGLRERKKHHTQQLILDTATRLFAERGFDGVTVAEIARAAELSEMTVFNYFPTKEDLVFSRMEFFEERLVAAVEQRDPGESAVACFGRVLLVGIDQPAARADMIAKAATLIRASPALQAREREVTARYTARLAHVFTAETGAGADDIEAWAAAERIDGRPSGTGPARAQRGPSRPAWHAAHHGCRRTGQPRLGAAGVRPDGLPHDLTVNGI